MLRRGAQRFLDAAIVLVTVSFASFLLAKQLPGDPVLKTLGENAPPEKYVALRQELGLDRPIIVQYWDWLKNVLSGDMGRSLTPPHLDVWTIMKTTVPVTLELTVLALLISVGVAIPLAMWCAYKEGSFLDRIVTATSIGAVTIPSFVIAFLLILMFVINVPIFPRLGWVRISDDLQGNLTHALVPAISLAIPMLAQFTQILRNDLVNTLKSDYITTARALGHPPWKIMLFWALRPALLSLVTVVGISTGYIMGGTAVVEVMFGQPGLGLLLVNTISDGDLPVVQAVTLLITAAFVLLNTTTDILYGFLDPRIRRGARV